MTDKTTSNESTQRETSETLRNWLMIFLTLIFVCLYAAAFSGKLDPLKDNTMLTRLEPVLFVVIGYYFGRVPWRQSEKTLKVEIDRQTNRADAAQYAKNQAQLERETLEEKIKNARIALCTDDQSKPVRTALGILDS